MESAGTRFRKTDNRVDASLSSVTSTTLIAQKLLANFAVQQLLKSHDKSRSTQWFFCKAEFH
jgi:hypothetical protein